MIFYIHSFSNFDSFINKQKCDNTNIIDTIDPISASTSESFGYSINYS